MVSAAEKRVEEAKRALEAEIKAINLEKEASVCRDKLYLMRPWRLHCTAHPDSFSFVPSGKHEFWPELADSMPQGWEHVVKLCDGARLYRVGETVSLHINSCNTVEIIAKLGIKIAPGNIAQQIEWLSASIASDQSKLKRMIAIEDISIGASFRE